MRRKGRRAWPPLAPTANAANVQRRVLDPFVLHTVLIKIKAVLQEVLAILRAERRPLDCIRLSNEEITPPLFVVIGEEDGAVSRRILRTQIFAKRRTCLSLLLTHSYIEKGQKCPQEESVKSTHGHKRPSKVLMT